MKQAFLILDHTLGGLEDLIRFLDSPNVFFYIHIDKKVAVPESLRNIPSCNPIVILHDRKVEWGHQSIILAELDLFTAAFQNNQIEWFHLISGSDFPLKRTEEILKFFEQAEGIDGFMESEPLPAHFLYRMELFHLLIKRSNTMHQIERFIQNKLNALQVKLGIKRPHPQGKPWMYGSNWVDLRRNAVKRLLENRDHIIASTKYTTIGDEIYMQTFLQNYGLNFVNDNLRYIDWSDKMPSPKSLDEEDFERVMSSGKLFARKFDKVGSAKLRRMIIDALKTGN